MDFRATPVGAADVVPLHRITVRPDQDGFVAPNAVTMAQQRFETGSYDFCLWDSAERVGLLAVIDMAEHEDRQDGIDNPNAVYVWRLLIAADRQGNGYGRAALAFAETWDRARGRTLCQVQAVEDNRGAIAAYLACGYALTGKKAGREIQLQKPL